MVLQSEAAECGLACLAMVASYHGQHTDPTALRRRFGFSLKGATLKDVIAVADRIGLASRPLRLELDELGMLRTPCILHWDLNHFVVLKAVGARRRSPSTTRPRACAGCRSPSVSRHFTGVALELTPTGGFEPAEAPPRVRIRALLGQHHRAAARRSGTCCCSPSPSRSSRCSRPLFLGLTVDQAIVSADRGLLATLAVAFGLLLVLQVGDRARCAAGC